MRLFCCVSALSSRVNPDLFFHFRSPGDPVQVQWESTAFFTSDSVVIPTPDFLNGVLDESLEDPEEYIDSLDQLSSENPFSTTTDAMFATPKDPPSSSSPSTTRNNASGMPGIIGAVAGLTLLLAGFVLYRNRRKLDEHDSDANRNRCKGDKTVGGDTFMGDTHASSTDCDDTSNKNCSRTGMHWANPEDDTAKQPAKASLASTRHAVEDFDAFVSSGDDWGSMSDLLSDALASMADTDDGDGIRQSGLHGLNSPLRRLKENLVETEASLDDTNFVRTSARRLKTVAEIEQLLVDGKELVR
jgi:hypothetical protein